MHDLLRVLTFQVVNTACILSKLFISAFSLYTVCNLSKLFISAFSYGYGGVFKLKMVDITVGCKTSSHTHMDECLISEVLMIKHTST